MSVGVICLFCNAVLNEPRHEICNNLVCATTKASDQPAYMLSLITSFASSMSLKLMTDRTVFGDSKLIGRLHSLV